MDVEETDIQVSIKRENLSLGIASIMNLGRLLGPEDTVRLCMYMNVPTTKLVLSAVKAGENEQEDTEFAASMIMIWRNMKADLKDREKRKNLEEALRLVGREKLADFFLEKYENDLEMLPEELETIIEDE